MNKEEYIEEDEEMIDEIAQEALEETSQMEVDEEDAIEEETSIEEDSEEI